MAGKNDKQEAVTGGRPGAESGKTYGGEEVGKIIEEQLAAHRVMIVDDLRAEIHEQVAAQVAKAMADLPGPALLSSTLEPSGPEPLSDAELALLDAACEAYGIPDKHLLGADIDWATGEAVLVTSGGAKVRFAEGQKVEKLSAIRITGVNPNPKKRQITGAKK